VIRKDFLIDPYQVIEARAIGADCVLLIVAALSDAQLGELNACAREFGLDVLVEVHDADELERALPLDGALLGINNRNLKSLAIDLATPERLASSVPTGRLLVSESGLQRPADLARMMKAGARCFLVGESLMAQEDVEAAFKAGELYRDFIAVVRFQGVKAIGMPELHKLTPPLGVLQARGHRVAIVTDGRMSGASGKVPAAIHVTPEAAAGGPLGKLRDGDVVRLDALAGTLEAKVDATEWAAREAVRVDLSRHHVGMGRELFACLRNAVGAADAAVTVFGATDAITP
jgi:hypothetical protein